jgi:hypothetical protein
MANFLGIFYLSVLIIFSFLYMVYYISEWIDRMAKRKRTSVIAPEKSIESKSVLDVVGKSTTAFLAPLTSASIEPLMSEDLEMELKSEAKTESDIISDEVEANLNAPYIPDEDELEQYRNDDADLQGEFSQGLTFEQISHAVEVVQGGKTGETEELLAGETLTVMPTDFLDMICMQADHEAMVKKLIAGYLDFPGKMKPVPVLVANFDINKYV